MAIPKTTGYTEIVKITEAALDNDRDKVIKYINKFMVKFPESDLIYPFTQLLKGEKNPSGLGHGDIIHTTHPTLPSDEEKPALQPLPEKMPEWFANYFNGRGNDAISCYIHCKNIFGTQPREWWMDLKKGDKVMYQKKEYVFEAVMLQTIDDYSFLVDNCVPYTDPTQSFRDKLSPEMQVEFDKLMERNKT